MKIELLKEIDESLQEFCDDYGTSYSNAYQDEYIAIIEALEKQVPKKPVKDNEGVGLLPRTTCPVCKMVEFGWREHPDYCECCGQALDWSDGE